MASVGSGTARQIIDSDGDVVTVTNNRLDVNATLGVGSSTFTTFAQFAVGTAALQLSHASATNNTSTDCKEIIIQPDFDNAGYIMVGDSGLVADSEGVRLNAGDTFILAVSAVANVYLRADQASQNVNISIVK